MIQQTGSNAMAKTTFFQSKVVINCNINTGRLVKIITDGKAIRPVLYAAQYNNAHTTGHNTNGISMIGLYIIRNPKVTGSLMLKIAAGRAAFDTVLSVLDFERIPINTRDNIFPAPPKELLPAIKKSALKAK